MPIYVAMMSEEPSHVAIRPSILYFGTPVVLLSTLNPDGSPNLAPMSSAWALGTSVILGLGEAGQSIGNLRRHPECVINLPSADMWQKVELLAPLTGRNPIPESKRQQFRFEPRKYEAAGLTPQASTLVRPPRVREAPLQLEARVQAIYPSTTNGDFAIVETDVIRVHASPNIVIPDTNWIDITRWQPLLYVFRHYFGLGCDLGKTFRADW